MPPFSKMSYIENKNMQLYNGQYLPQTLLLRLLTL